MKPEKCRQTTTNHFKPPPEYEGEKESRGLIVHCLVEPGQSTQAYCHSCGLHDFSILCKQLFYIEKHCRIYLVPIQDDVKCPYRSKHKIILLYLQCIIYRPETLHITQDKHGILFTRTCMSSQILHIYGVSVVICGGLPTRQAASNHHKPPLKHRKYAGFGTMDISSGLWWFACIYLVSLPIVPNCGGDLRWSMWWFVFWIR